MKKIGDGNTAEVYEYGNHQVCKLFKEDYPIECVKLEFENTKTMYELGIRVPRTFQIVEIEGRHGIIYEKIIARTFFLLKSENEEAGDQYLKGMQVEKEQIEQFLDVIVACRKYEGTE